MSCEPLLSVRELSKRYFVYDNPHARLLQFGISAINRLGIAANGGPILRNRFREFWALRHVTFELGVGGSLGIVGRNGAGKSTLTQIIAGTVAATEGSVRCGGRVGALLELGAGFSPEFTGRENLGLNAALNGYSGRELTRVVEAAIEFAEIGDFIDQPIKTYSSGMFARVAFAGAISVRPDLLIVDEILSVGDMAFQQKCINRIRELRNGGMALIFVSHGPDAIKSLCEKALFLIDGHMVDFGLSDRVVDRYFDYIRTASNEEALRHQSDLGGPVGIVSRVGGTSRYGSGHAQFQSIRLTDELGQDRLAFELDAVVRCHVRLKAMVRLAHLSLSFLVRDGSGVDLFGTTTFDQRYALPHLEAGQELDVSFEFRASLRPGTYGVCVALNRVSQRDLSDNLLLDQVDGAAAFSVHPDPSRPVHYKVHLPILFDWKAVSSTLEPSDAARV